jgi:hypothetical protein
MQTSIKSVIILSLFILLSNNSAFSKNESNKKNTLPKKWIVIVVDSLRPDYISRFKLKNIQNLQSRSANYTDALVGYIGSETVVSHMVIATGLPPKMLPFSDEIFRDTTGVLGNKNDLYNTGSLSTSELHKILSTVPKKNFLSEKTRAIHEGKVFSVGQKGYAAAELSGPYGDSMITFKKANGKCFPDGINLPQYIVKDPTLMHNCTDQFSTEDSFYPADIRQSPISLNDSSSGDAWVASIVEKIIKNEDFSAIFATFAAVDKYAHLLGDHNRIEEKHFKSQYTLEEIAVFADQQIGRIIAALKSKGLENQTGIVLTSDHGGQYDSTYLGNGASARYGLLKNDAPKSTPFWLEFVAKSGEVEASIADTAMRFWLKVGSDGKRTIKQIQSVSRWTEIYQKVCSLDHCAYQQVAERLSKTSPAFKKWAKKTSQSILDNSCNAQSADIIVLLDDDVGFDLIGDHGGAQEKVQRIPLMIYRPGVNGKKINKTTHLYDLHHEMFN